MDLAPIHARYADLLATPGVNLHVTATEAVITGPQAQRVLRIDRAQFIANAGSFAWIEHTGPHDRLVVHDEQGGTWDRILPGNDREWGDGFAIAVFRWSGDHVVLIYRGEHGLHICTAHDLRLSYIEVHGEAFTLHANEVLFSAYGPEADVHRYSIPRLERLERIPAAVAREQGIVPLSVHHPDHPHHLV